MRNLHRGLALLSLLASGAASAGPPFATDDPEPAPDGHYEIYLFSAGTHTAEGWDATLPGFEINYGAGPDLQLAAAVEQAYERPKGGEADSHYGAIELGVKYRFVQEDEAGWRPQIAFYPSLELAESERDPSTFLPLWLQKSIGEWEVFGGGGLHLNPGRGRRDNWFGGIAAMRPVSEHLELGGEVFRETSDVEGEAGSSGFNLAALYEVSESWHVVASAGRGFAHASSSNEFSYYVGLELTPP
jgi:hypothetical protein